MNKNEILDLLNANSAELFAKADKVRYEYIGNEVELRGLMEISNICSQNCLYCGLRKDNQETQRYFLTKDEIIALGKKAKDLNYHTIVLQSGESNIYSQKQICEIVEELKKFDVAITLSLGEKSKSEYQAYKSAGADRYLLRIETTDEQIYQAMHPNASLENRKKCLYSLKEIGFETGSGCLIGLPNQTLESIAEDICFFAQNDFDMIGIGPFIPSPNTPLSNNQHGNLELAIKTMAVTRIALKDINIPATTAMETLQKSGRKMALQSGANVVMINISGIEKYALYPGRDFAKDDLLFQQKIITEICSLGRSISKTQGFRGDII